MQTFDQSLLELFRRDLISYEEALRQATNPDDFKLKVDGIQSTSEMVTESMQPTGSLEPSDSGSPFDFGPG
jgi:twitching motility protein PilT